jgi:hypothetical protein
MLLAGGFLLTKVLLVIILVIHRLFQVKDYEQIHRCMQKLLTWIQYKFSMAKKKGVSLAVGRGEKLPVSKGAGLTAKGRAKYNAATGSNLKAPQPEGGARKKSFCARMSGMPGPMKDEKGRPTRKAASLKRWKC